MSRAFLRTVHALVGVAALLAASVGAAQTQPLSPDRVTFFTEPNFRGDALTVEAGASVPNLAQMARPNQQPWIFAISSVKVEGAAKAVVHSGVNFTGDRFEITRNIADLYGEARGREPGTSWDRSIASVTVVGPPRQVVTQPAPVVRYETPPPPTVVVVPSPAAPPVVHRGPRLDPRAADLIIQRAYREVLDRPADPIGLRTYRERLLFQGWSERQVIEHLQRSDEARNISADQAIAKAYREVLGRDPDPNGLAHYRAKWRDGWTQGQIRDDLRRSHEGRNGAIHNAITRAYRELLGRDPDPAGYANYERLMRERGYSERDVRAAIMSGDEYRQKHGRKR